MRRSLRPTTRLVALARSAAVLFLMLALIGGPAAMPGVRAQTESTGETTPGLSVELGSLPVAQVTSNLHEDAYPALVETGGKLLAVYVRYGELWSSVSADGGATWTAETRIGDCCNSNPSLVRSSDGAAGTLWLVYDRSGGIRYRTSTDQGASWSPEQQVVTGAGGDADPAFYVAPDGRLGVVWHGYEIHDGDIVESGLYTTTSTDGGMTWAPEASFSPGAWAPAVGVRQDGRLVAVFNRENGELWQRTSSDGGATWSAETRIAGCCRRYPSLAWAGGLFWLAYENDGDVWYRTSANGGATWTTEAAFTRFAGPDRSPALAALPSGRPGIAWSSDRSGNPEVWYGSPGERDDINPPPYVEWFETSPRCNLDSNTVITVKARALDETGVASVELVWTLDGAAQDPLPMYDDGTHGDEAPGDTVWTARYGPLPEGSHIAQSVRAADTGGNTYLVSDGVFTVLAPFAKTTDVLLVPDATGEDPEHFRSYYTSALAATGTAFDTWNPQLRCLPDAAVLDQYKTGLVVWAAAHWLNAPDGLRNALQGYLDGGGRLFLTGQDIAQGLHWSGNAAFLNNYLYVKFVQEDSRLYALRGADGSPVGDGLQLTLMGGDSAANQWSKDEIDPLGPAQVAFTYHSTYGTIPSGVLSGTEAGPVRAGATPSAPAEPPVTPTRMPSPTMAPPGPAPTPIPTPTQAPTPVACLGSCTAGLTVDTGTYKVVYFAFGFEAINGGEQRAEVMGRVIGWLGDRLVLLSPANGRSLPPGKVTFTWTNVGATSYEIQVDTSPGFDSPALIDEVVSGTSYEAQFLSRGKRYWRVRPAGGEWSAARSFTIAVQVVPITGNTGDDVTPALVQTADGGLLAVFVRNGTLVSLTSTNGGANWGSEKQVAGCCHYNPSLARASDGRLWLAYQRESDVWYRTSTDNGLTWGAEARFPTEPGEDLQPAILQAADGKLWMVWLGSFDGYPRHVLYKTSSNGIDWSAARPLSSMPWENDSPTLAVAQGGRVVVVWQRYGVLWQRSTADGGATWSDERQLGACCSHAGPSLAASGQDLWLVYEHEGDVRYRNSANSGDSWSEEKWFTRFVGPDVAPSAAALGSGDTGIAWQSDRSGNPDVWYGSLFERADLLPPPYIFYLDYRPALPDANDPILFQALAQDETGVVRVSLVWTLNGVEQADVPMYDDGTHGDQAAGDRLWSVEHPPLPEGATVTFRAVATDTQGLTYRYPGQKSFRVLPTFVKTGQVLLVLDAGGYSASTPSDTGWFRPYYTNALDALGYRYDVWDTGLRGEPPAAVLGQYARGGVIWAVPYWGYLTSGGSASIAALQGYLEAGGRLFVTGQNLAEALSWSSLMHDYLHATVRQGDTGLFAVAGATGDPIGDGLGLNISGGDGANDQSSKDEVDPLAPAEVVLTYRADAPHMLAEPQRPAGDEGVKPLGSTPAGNVGSGTAGLRVAAGKYKVVYFAFGFEGINSAADRQAVMERVLVWLEVGQGEKAYLPLILAK